MKKALIVRGGWDGHEPMLVSERFARMLRAEDFEVEISDSLDVYLDKDKMMALDLIVSLWTMGEITPEQCKGCMEAVASGVGLMGSHGGMCDSFRNNVDWQFMTGSQWVAHPGNDGTPYRVNIKKSSDSEIIAGIDDFSVCSEQYYLHVDPSINVLATTRFPVAAGGHVSNGEVDVPVIYTKRWGKGRVFYTSLGHHDDVFDLEPAAITTLRGMLWAAEGKALVSKK